LRWWRSAYRCGGVVVAGGGMGVEAGGGAVPDAGGGAV
jgi:hypothetical protein